MDSSEPTHTAADLRAVIRWQAFVAPLLGAQVGVYILFAVGLASGHLHDTREAVAYLVLIVVGIGAVAGVAVALLAANLKGATSPAVLGLLAAVPLVGVAAMAVVYRRANAVLRRHGVRVGPFGPNRSDLARLAEEEEAWAPREDEGW